MRGLTRAAGMSVATALLVVAGCSSSGGDATRDTGITLPSSIDVGPQDTTGTSQPGGTGTTSTTTAATLPALEGASVVESLQATPGAVVCTGGTIPVVVTFSVRSDRPVRVYNVYLDGSDTPVASSNSPDPVTIPAVPCDGLSHQVLLIAAVAQDDVATQSAAFRTPGPA